MDGGQQKILVTLTVCPLNEKEKVERKKEPDMKNRYKSSSTHRVIIGARVYNVLECYYNLKVLLDSLNLHDLSKNFRLVCDIKVMNMLLGIQSCSSMHPCPYCNGYKFDKMGEKTNQKGLWLKGEPRTKKSLLEDYQKWAMETECNRKVL